MIIVPIPGDNITSGGLPSKVLSFAGNKPEGLAVLVQVEGKSGQETVFFKDIETINDQKVKFIKNKDGYKVFETDGFIERTYQLPQVGDVVSSKVLGGVSTEYKVYRISLGIPDQTSRGIVLDTHERDSDEVTEITLNQIHDIKKTLFSKSDFQKFYSEYMAKGTE